MTDTLARAVEERRSRKSNASYSPVSGRPPKPGVYWNRRGEYIGPRPFGPLLLRHKAAARLLGIRPKDLTKLNVRRELYQGTYVYDPCEIYLLAGLPIPSDAPEP